jgi:hypothetical protein
VLVSGVAPFVLDLDLRKPTVTATARLVYV